MRFVITGGAGFLGVNLVRYLLAKGHQVVSVDIAPFTYPERDRVTEVTADIRDKKALVRAFTGADVVIHTAAALPLYSPEDIYSTDAEGTNNVLTVAYEVGVERVVHVSSTAVYGIPDHHPLVESDRLHGVGQYGEAKVAAEAVCEKFRRKGYCVPVIRPKSFVGPERLGVFALFYDWAASGKSFPMIGSGNNRYQLLDVDDLCDALYAAATMTREKVNDTFNVGAKEFTTMKEDWQAVLDEAGFGKKIIPLPKGPVIAVLRLLEALKLSPLYAWVYATAGEDSFVSIEKAERVLSFTPRYSNKQALVRNYRWYLAHRSEFKHQSGVSHRVPWKQGLLALAKPFFIFPLSKNWMPVTEVRLGNYGLSVATLLLMSLFVYVLALQWRYPYAYIASDSFTYFTLVKNFWNADMLFSFSGIDHTTGIHLAWYFLLLPLWPLFGISLPQGALAFGAALILASCFLLFRTFGVIVGISTLIIVLTAWGARTVNNGMESAIAFFALTFFAVLLHSYEPLLRRRLGRAARPLLTLGVMLGAIAWTRLDYAVLLPALGLVLIFTTLSRVRLSSALKQLARAGMFLGVGFAVLFIPLLLMFLHYGDSVLPVAGMIKSTFPHIIDLQGAPTFRKFPLALVLLATATIIYIFVRKQVSILLATLFIGTAVLYGYNFFFVQGVGVWYSTLPAFAIGLSLGLILRAIYVPRALISLMPLFLGCLIGSTSLLIAWQHTAHPYLKNDWTAPYRAAAEELSVLVEDGETAAETSDGVVSFYARVPVYSLTGLGNNRDYYDAVVEGRVKTYLSEHHISYIVSESAVGPHVPSHSGYQGAEFTHALTCSDPAYDREGIKIFPVSTCVPQ